MVVARVAQTQFERLAHLFGGGGLWADEPVVLHQVAWRAEIELAGDQAANGQAGGLQGHEWDGGLVPSAPRPVRPTAWASPHTGLPRCGASICCCSAVSSARSSFVRGASPRMARSTERPVTSARRSAAEGPERSAGNRHIRHGPQLCSWSWIPSMVSPVPASMSRSGHSRWASRRAAAVSRAVSTMGNHGTSPPSTAASSSDTGRRKGMTSKRGAPGVPCPLSMVLRQPPRPRRGSRFRGSPSRTAGSPPRSAVPRPSVPGAPGWCRCRSLLLRSV